MLQLPRIARLVEFLNSSTRRPQRRKIRTSSISGAAEIFEDRVVMSAMSVSPASLDSPAFDAQEFAPPSPVNSFESLYSNFRVGMRTIRQETIPQSLSYGDQSIGEVTLVSQDASEVLRLEHRITSRLTLDPGQPGSEQALGRKLGNQNWALDYASLETPNADGFVFVATRRFQHRGDIDTVKIGGGDPFNSAPDLNGKIQGVEYFLSGQMTVGMKPSGELIVLNAEADVAFRLEGRVKSTGQLGEFHNARIRSLLVLKGNYSLGFADTDRDGQIVPSEVRAHLDGTAQMDARISAKVGGIKKIGWNGIFTSNLDGTNPVEEIQAPAYEETFSKLDDALKNRLANFDFAPAVEKALHKELPFVGSVDRILKISNKIRKSLDEKEFISRLPGDQQAAAMQALIRGESVPLFEFEFDQSEIRLASYQKNIPIVKAELLNVVRAELYAYIRGSLDVSYNYEGTVLTTDTLFENGSGFTFDAEIAAGIAGSIKLSFFNVASASGELGLSAEFDYRVDSPNGVASFRDLNQHPRENVTFSIDVDLYTRIKVNVIGIKWQKEFDLVDIIHKEE